MQTSWLIQNILGALLIFGASLSKTHLVRCMAEVPVAMHVCMCVCNRTFT